MNKDSALYRLLHSARALTALVGIASIIAVQLGLDKETANQLSIHITTIVSVLILGQSLISA